MLVARQKLQRNFGAAAAEYDARAEFQHIQTRRVLDAALMLLPTQARIADIGCGTGYFAHVASQKRPHWEILGIDIAPGMCAVAATRCTAINADAAQLPLANASMDAVTSSLCYQWVENHSAAFAEIARVLKPGGQAILATLGEASLHELRAAAEGVQLPLNLLPMRTITTTRDALAEAGLHVTLADRHIETRHYASISTLMNSMRGIGAGNNFTAPARAFLPPKRWAALATEYEKQRTPQGIPATWEHHFFVLSKPL